MGLLDWLGDAFQKSQSMATGSTLGGLRQFGLLDRNSELAPEAQDLGSGLMAGIKGHVKPHEVLTDAFGWSQDDPSFWNKLLGGAADVAYDPLILAGAAGKAGSFGPKIGGLLKGAKAASYMENPTVAKTIGAGAARALGRTYAGTLATPENDVLQGFGAGQLGAGVGKTLNKVAPAVGSKIGNYIQGRAVGKALADEGEAIAPETVDKLSAIWGQGKNAPTTAPPVQAGAAARLNVPTPTGNMEPFNLPNLYKMGDETIELPGMEFDPTRSGMQATQPWKPNLAPSTSGGGALFDPAMLDQPGLFDPSALAPGKLAPEELGTNVQLEFPGTRTQTQFPGVTGTQQQLPQGPVGTPVGPRNTGAMPFGNPQTSELDTLEQMFKAPAAPPMAPPLEPGRGGLGVPAPRDFQIPQPPQNPAIPPWLQQGGGQGGPPPGIQQAAQRQTAGPMGQGPTPQGIPTGPSGFQSTLPEAATGGQIVDLIRQAMAEGVPYNEVMRVILKHQFPGRI